MDKLLLVDPDKCTGCLSCEKICSLKHENQCIPTRSRIKVLRKISLGPNGFFVSTPVVCQQCETPMCKEVCPANAIYQDAKTGAYLVNEDKCVGCRLCTIACPLGAIEVNFDTNKAMKCDFCSGDPLCAKVCLDSAVSFVEKEKIGYKLRRDAMKKLSDRLEQPQIIQKIGV